jgi:hypothetical protein
VRILKVRSQISFRKNTPLKIRRIRRNIRSTRKTRRTRKISMTKTTSVSLLKVVSKLNEAK